MNKINKTSFITIVGVLLLLLFLYATSYSISLIYKKTSFALISVAISCVLLIINKKGVKISSNRVVLGMLLFAVVLINNHNIDHNDFGSDFVFLSLLVLWIIPPQKKWFECLAIIMFVVGLVFAVTTYMFYFSRDLYVLFVNKFYPNESLSLLMNYDRGAIYGLAKNSSFNSAFILYSLAFFFSYILGKKKRKNFVFVLVSILIVLALYVAIFLTVKRNAVLFGTIAFIICYLTVSKNKHRFAIVVGSLAVAVALLFAASLVVPGIATLIQKTISQTESGNITNGRWERYQATITIFKNSNLFFGRGWGALRSLYGNDPSILTDSTHNVYLQLLAETGFVGFSIFILFFFYNYLRCFDLILAIKKESPDKSVSSYLCFCLFLQTYFLLYCITGNPLYDPAWFMPYLLSTVYVETYIYMKKRNEMYNLGA